MRLLFTGRGGSGSWAIRGEQLGRACGAEVKAKATLDDCRSVDLIVVVKKITEETLAALRGSGRPWVLDVLDLFPQPGCSAWSSGEAIGWVQSRLRKLAPTAVIWPNHRMRQDCDVGLPSLVLPHHYRPGIQRNPIRETVQVVGYEGAEAYIAKWRPVIEFQCKRRGWKFVVNPSHLADLDIVLALRSGQWDCYATTHWKSNVKLANAHGSGTPFVGQREDGYLETCSGGEYWTETPHGLDVCFEWLAPQGVRQQVRDRFLEKAYSVDEAAADLTRFLHGL